jgi:amidase
MATIPLHYQTITALSAQLASRRLSPVAVTRAMLDRIGQLDGQLRSYATVMADQALADAGRAEQEIAAGRVRGPLHGVPIAVKDLCFTRGVRTMGGTKALAEHVPSVDATVVTRLAEAGAVLLGKLNTTEGAMGGYHPDFPIPRNPWRADRYAGASSSGSGVATAAGLCFGSLGSDTGGSIRFPAAANGVVGLKPTWGRVSRFGVLALAESLDHVGPMTRSTRDAALMLQAIAGPDPRDPTALLEPAPDLLGELDAGVDGLRLGFDERYAADGVDPQLAAAVRAAVVELERRGARIVPVTLPSQAAHLEAWPTLCAAEAVAAHASTYPSQRDSYGPWFRSWLDRGARVTGADYARAHALRLACAGLLRSAFAPIDALLCPAMPGPPGPVTPSELYGAAGGDDIDMSFLRFTAPFNFNGAPTLTLPCGLSDDRLPLSLQIVGRPLGEAVVCRVGQAYERATSWHTTRPPV